MKKIFHITFLLFSLQATSQTLKTPFESGNGNQSPDYKEIIQFYNILAESHPRIQVQSIGTTDSGEPLHLVLFDPETQQTAKEKLVILINNGIHPGEPDGIDATMLLFRDLAEKRISIPKNVQITTIPVYNIGGALNRGAYSRANQNGPEHYGFRGNARNYDLNRDFIKADTKNTVSFYDIFHLLNPDIFIDTHVSNGADYQYTLTYIATHHQKLGPPLGRYMHSEFTPALLSRFDKKKMIHTPYVTVYGKSPDNGFHQMMDYPRYSTGYAALFDCIGYMVETHMLKPYHERVTATYEFLLATLQEADTKHKKIKALKKENERYFKPGDSYTLLWEIDSSKTSFLTFSGYEALYKTSEVTGKSRLYYDTSKPYKKQIPYYSFYKPVREVTVPKGYIIPRSWDNIAELLRKNKIEVYPFVKDTLIEVEAYKIEAYTTSKEAYEGHYPHAGTTVKKELKRERFLKGDYWIPTEQPGIKYLIETLEPEAHDSFFNWNFFDSILQQKEYFSAYVFEEIATDLLENDPSMKEEFIEKKANNPSFSENASLQLDWIYKRSPYYEKTHNQYPVYRVMK